MAKSPTYTLVQPFQQRNAIERNPTCTATTLEARLLQKITVDRPFITIPCLLLRYCRRNYRPCIRWQSIRPLDYQGLRGPTRCVAFRRSHNRQRSPCVCFYPGRNDPLVEHCFPRRIIEAAALFVPLWKRTDGGLLFLLDFQLRCPRRHLYADSPHGWTSAAASGSCRAENADFAGEYFDSDLSESSHDWKYGYVGLVVNAVP